MDEDETIGELIDMDIPNKGDVTHRPADFGEHSVPKHHVGEIPIGDGVILEGGAIEIRALGDGPDGPRLNRPDIAAKGIGAMAEAFESTGATIDWSGVHLVHDEEEE